MSSYEDLIKKLGKLKTEQVNDKTIDIDTKSPFEIAKLINDEDKTVAAVVESQIPLIAQAAEKFADTIKNGGRIIYIGAGTSGRLGVLDAAECPPTFGTDPKQIVGVISGGYDTLILSQEGVEDQIEAAVDDLRNIGINSKDMLIGIAASSRTPYTLSGLKFAKEKEAATVFISCNEVDRESIPFDIDIVIELEVGPEVITGSTRLKSGTAQKMTLNMISTTAMVLLGKTYGNLMVDLEARSEKLAARSRKILIDLFDISLEQADNLLKESKARSKKQSL